jgi:hypothetical protein
MKLWKKPQPSKERETYAQRALRMEQSLKSNPATGVTLITRRYVDAVIDHIMRGDEPVQGG